MNDFKAMIIAGSMIVMIGALYGIGINLLSIAESLKVLAGR